MQNTKTTETRGINVFRKILETLPSGLTVAVADMSQATINAGTPIGIDTNGLGHIVKVAEAQANATNTATDYRVKKGHNFKVGNHIMAATGAKAQTITAITTTETAYDTLTVGTTIGTAVTAGDAIYEAVAANQSTGSAFKYTALGLIGEDCTIVAGDSNLVSVVVRGSVYTGNCALIGSAVKALLPQIIFA